MQGDGWLFFGILIFIFVLWLSTGGPTREISWSGPYITPLEGPGDRGEGYGEEPSFLSNFKRPGAGNANPGSGVGDLRDTIANASDYGNASSYRGQVTIKHSVSGLGANDPDEEYLTISVSSRAAGPITVSGWKIESTGRRAALTIGNGTGLPRSGAVNTITPIALNPGESAVIVTGKSPIGVSFRENLCTGYFDEYQSFTPALSQSCPSAGHEYDMYYGEDEACEASLKSVDRCSAARAGNGVSNTCRAFVNQYLNYNGCVAVHSGERGFYENTWRIYLGQNDDFFTKEHDTIRLLDSYGMTVDQLSY